MRLPTDVLERVWERLQPELQVATDFGEIATGPGAIDQGPTGMRLARFAEGTLAAALPAGIMPWCGSPPYTRLGGSGSVMD